MAKQKGIHQLKGKVGGMSYYGQKGVEGGLARSINSGLSNRVKTDEAYANTRLNAAEFGTAGSFAGACIRSISERKRAMMKDFASGDLAKVVRGIIQSETAAEWGKRNLSADGWQTIVADKLNQYAKLPFADYIGATISIGALQDEEQETINVSYQAAFPANWGSLLAAKGASEVLVKAFVVSVDNSGSTDAPFLSTARVSLLGEDTMEIGNTGVFKVENRPFNPEDVTEGDGHLVAALTVAFPIKTLGGKDYILQELCTYNVIKFTA